MKKTEQKPLYIREGRRFVKLGFGYSPNRMDVTGYFYNPDGTFSVSKRDDSIGIVILQTPKERIIAGLKAEVAGNWDHAKEIAKKEFNGNGKLPTEVELILINNNRSIDKRYATVICGIEYTSRACWYVDVSVKRVFHYAKHFPNALIGVIPVLRIKL